MGLNIIEYDGSITISLCVVGEREKFNFVHLNNNHYEFQSNFSNPHSD